MSDVAKINAAAAALDLVRDDMLVGLGTGSTASHFVRLLGRRVALGLRVRAVSTSEETARLARETGVPLVEPERVAALDIAVDGADEADPQFGLIKGGGGALLREKIVAMAARHFVVIVDETKLVPQLGAFPLPVEVTPFGWTLTAARVFDVLRAAKCGADLALRERAPGAPFRTDGGNYILDCKCVAIPDPAALGASLKALTGVVEHGLFVGMARTLIIGKAVGAEIRER